MTPISNSAKVALVDTNRVSGGAMTDQRGNVREGAAVRQVNVVRRAWPVLAGTAILAALWLGPLPEMSRRAFSPHMMLHLGVAVVAAPFVAFGFLRLTEPAELRHPLAAAVAASALEMLVVWGWHAPLPHEAAARETVYFVAQQGMFLAAGTCLWMVSFAGRSRESSGVGALAMLLTFTHMAMLGVLIAIAPSLLYAPDVCLGAFGFDRLEDQRFGGALMAVGGGLPYLVGGLVLAYRTISD